MSNATVNYILPLHRSIRRVCDYIDHNLDKQMTVTHLSEVAALSKYHFHRVFVASTNITVSKYILLARLKRASFELAFETDIKIIDIALKASFDSAEAFSRAFKRTFSQTPSEFRNQPQWPTWHRVLEQTAHKPIESTLNVDIVTFPKTQVAVLEHRGAPERVYETAGEFVNWRKSSGLSPIRSSLTFGLPNGDPSTMPASEFRFKIAGSVAKPIPSNDFGVLNAEIPAMRCAKVTHRGSHNTLEQTIYLFYQHWLVDSDEQPAAHPCFFQYLNLIHEVDECDLRTDVFLPLC